DLGETERVIGWLLQEKGPAASSQSERLLHWPLALPKSKSGADQSWQPGGRLGGSAGERSSTSPSRMRDNQCCGPAAYAFQSEWWQLVGCRLLLRSPGWAGAPSAHRISAGW